MNNTTNQAEYDFAMHDDRIRKHYAHAREKHPNFCDRITCLSEEGADTHLELYRALLESEECAGDLEAVDIIQCELYEAVQAYTHGDIAHAVEECYDVIATLLRMVDVLEGRQKLGKPEAKVQFVAKVGLVAQEMGRVVNGVQMEKFRGVAYDLAQKKIGGQQG